MKNASLFYPLLIVIAASSYGILSTIVKLAMKQGYTAAQAVSSQYIFGFALALILMLATQRKLPKLTKKGLAVMIFGGIFTSLTGIIYGQSLIYLPASIAVVMLFQFTWIGILIDCVLKRRLPSRIEVISLTVLFIGTILAAGVIDTDLSAIPLKGWLLGLLAAFCFAIFIQFNARPVEGVSNIMRTFIVSTVALIVVSLLLTPEIIIDGTITGGLWKYGLILGLFGIIFPIVLFSIAAPKVGGALSSILGAMELPVAVIVSVLVLGENLTAVQVIGIVVVLFGICIPSILTARIEKRRQHKKVEA